jgi:hypothetical protein
MSAVLEFECRPAVGGYDVVAFKQHLAAITIVFDVVNPVLALWRLVDRGSKLGLNEPEPRGGLLRLGSRQHA